MKVIFNREELLGKLKRAFTFIPKKAIIPAHEVFLFNINDGILSVTATDGEKQITVSCPSLKCEGNMIFTIPAKLVTNTLGLMSEPEVLFVFKDKKIEVKCGNSKYKMQSDDGSAYPLFAQMDPIYEASFMGASFNEAIDVAKRYAGSQNPSTALQGICFRMDNENKINVFGANNFSMAKVIVSPRSIHNWDDILIFVSAMSAIEKCIDDGDVVDVTHNKKRIEIRTDNVTIVCAAVDVKYPDINEFFKQRTDTFVLLNTFQMLQAMQRIDQYTKEEDPVMKIDIKTTSISLSVINENYNQEGLEEVECVAQEEISIGVNSKFMINIIESFKSDTFKLYYNNEQSPMFVEPSDNARDNNRFFLVAPVYKK